MSDYLGQIVEILQRIEREERERMTEAAETVANVICRDGSIHCGRNIDSIGAHCQGHNTGSIGICYIGGVAADGHTPKDTRTPKQRQALRTLVEALQQLYPGATVHGHNDYAAKACPSFRVETDL